MRRFRLCSNIFKFLPFVTFEKLDGNISMSFRNVACCFSLMGCLSLALILTVVGSLCQFVQPSVPQICPVTLV